MTLMPADKPRRQLNTRIPTDLHSALKREAERRQVSKTYIVERALIAWLERNHDPFGASND